jgi:hypothetical protein
MGAELAEPAATRTQKVGLKYWTPGLKTGFFWRITYIDGLEDGVGPGVDIVFSGYADEDDLDLEG